MSPYTGISPLEVQAVLLGIFAAISGIIYALAKFLTTLRVRRLREALNKAQHDQQRAQQLVDVLDDKKKVERNKKSTLRKDASKARVSTEELYSRLQAELPPTYHPRLAECLTQNPQADPSLLRVLHELKLTDKITAALDSLSLLIVEFLSTDPSVRSISLGQFAQLLEQAKIRFHAPDQATLVCLFDRPLDALELMRQFGRDLPADLLPPVRAGLYTGVHITEDSGEIARFLAQHLQLAQKLSSRAPVFTLLLNENAYQSLENQDDIQLFDRTALLYKFSLKQQKEGTQSTS
jgi:hypothetical protein